MAYLLEKVGIDLETAKAALEFNYANGIQGHVFPLLQHTTLAMLQHKAASNPHIGMQHKSPSFDRAVKWFMEGKFSELEAFLKPQG